MKFYLYSRYLWYKYYIQFLFKVLFNEDYHTAVHTVAKRERTKKYNLAMLDQLIDQLEQYSINSGWRYPPLCPKWKNGKIVRD
jgi:hypothetical protein